MAKLFDFTPATRRGEFFYGFLRKDCYICRNRRCDYGNVYN